jgi:hypothetical protein
MAVRDAQVGSLVVGLVVAERGAGTGSARTSLTNDDGDVQAGSWKEKGDDEASR